jgi:hypothetical protein
VQQEGLAGQKCIHLLRDPLRLAIISEMSAVASQLHNAGRDEPSEFRSWFRALYMIVGRYDNQHLSFYSFGCLFKAAAEGACHIVDHLRSHLALQIFRPEILTLLVRNRLQKTGKPFPRRFFHAVLRSLQDKIDQRSDTLGCNCSVFP